MARRDVEKNLPPTNEGYGTHEYWEQRYTNEADGTTFDWFLTPSYLLPLFEELTGVNVSEGSTSKGKGKGKEARILMLGCGNSALGEVMYDAGWTNIVNVDYSKTVIDQMIQRHHESRPKMKWLEMDVLNLDFRDGNEDGDGEFDLVVDKGTMDAMLTTKGDPWNPSEKDINSCTREVSEALRVLRKQPGSKFVYFTFGQPHFRKRYLQDRPGFKFDYKEIGPEEGFAYFMYTLTYIG